MEDVSSAVLDRLVPAGTTMLTVHAPARLHLGFLDPGASLGRRFGSLGLVLDAPETRLSLAAASGAQQVVADDPAAAAELPRARAHLEALQRETGRSAPLSLVLHRVLPTHAGFGSGTQLALAIGRAFAAWHGLDVGTAQLARWLGRGLRSGVGIAGFDHGGLLVDGGPGTDGSPAPVIARLDFPEAWRIVLVTDTRRHGLAGEAERHALAALAPLPAEHAADICHQVLMRVLPGAASGDFGAFAAGITRIQERLGAHYAPAQGGSGYVSAAVERVVRALGAAGAGIGQSSWGPTGFAFLPSQAAAEAALAALGPAEPGLGLAIVRGRNRGADVTTR